MTIVIGDAYGSNDDNKNIDNNDNDNNVHGRCSSNWN